MNEVKISPSVTPSRVTAAASSAGSDGSSVNVAASGKVLPPEKNGGDPSAERAGVLTADPVSQAVAELNDYVQNEQRDLLFSVDDGSGDMVVRVVDRESGELIRQIPNEVVLHLAEKARLNEPLQLIDMHG